MNSNRGSVFLIYRRRNFPLNPGLGELGTLWEWKSCCSVHGSPWKCWFGHGSKQPSRVSSMYRWEFIWTDNGTNRSGNLPVTVTAARHRLKILVTILPSVVNKDIQTLSICWFTAHSMSNFFLSVNTRFGSLLFWCHSRSSYTFGLSLQYDGVWVLDSEPLLRVLVLDHLSTVCTWWICPHSCCSRSPDTSTRVTLDLFARGLNELRETESSFSTLTLPIDGIASLLEFQNNIPCNCSVHLETFCNVRIFFSTFVQFYDTISDNSHSKNSFKFLWYIWNESTGC